MTGAEYLARKVCRDCDRIAVAKGRCRKHYAVAWRLGRMTHPGPRIRCGWCASPTPPGPCSACGRDAEAPWHQRGQPAPEVT